MKKAEMTCITCPVGCHLTAVKDESAGEWLVSGNTCRRGAEYARAELTHPTRMLTSTVRVSNRPGKYLPVKTARPISKERLFDAMRVLRGVSVEAPVYIGQIIVDSLLGETNLLAADNIF